MSTSTRTPTATRSYSVRELRAAAAALLAGRFCEPALTPPSAPVAPPAPSLAAAGPTAAARSPAKAPETRRADGVTDGVTAHRVDGAAGRVTGGVVRGLEPLVRVRAANAGAGASTVALALADVADAAGIPTRVLDAAAPAWSGLLGATTAELGAADGWRRGRRGANVWIDRVQDRVQVPAAVPAPSPSTGIALNVLDAGWSMRELAAANQIAPETGSGTGPGTWLTATPAQVEVIVTRAGELALSQTEATLCDLADPLASDRVVVVVVGARRWSERGGFANAGRRLRQAREQQAVLFAPLLRPRALPGLGPEPLPRQLRDLAQRLLERVTTTIGPLSGEPGPEPACDHEGGGDRA